MARLELVDSWLEEESAKCKMVPEFQHFEVTSKHEDFLVHVDCTLQWCSITATFLSGSSLNADALKTHIELPFFNKRDSKMAPRLQFKVPFLG